MEVHKMEPKAIRRAFFVEEFGSDGLYGMDDAFLEQVRLLALQIDPQRHVGGSLPEFRTLLREQMNHLTEHSFSLQNNLLYIFYCEQVGKHGQPKICGMMTFQALPCVGRTYAIIGDLIIASDYRETNYADQLIKKCLEHAKRANAKSINYIVPPRHAGWLKSKLTSNGFEEKGSMLFHLQFN